MTFLSRLLRQLCGCSRRDQIISQYMNEHRYAVNKSRADSIRTAEETRQNVEEAQILVNGLITDIRDMKR